MPKFDLLQNIPSTTATGDGLWTGRYARLNRNGQAFGSSLKERTVNFGSNYRYGFNSQEQDAEMGDYYAFEYRIHDARIGRFLSVDPLAPEYPWNSTYAFAENRVIDGIDLEGKEYKDATGKMLNTGVFNTDPYALQYKNRDVLNSITYGGIIYTYDYTGAQMHYNLLASSNSIKESQKKPSLNVISKIGAKDNAQIKTPPTKTQIQKVNEDGLKNAQEKCSEMLKKGATANCDDCEKYKDFAAKLGHDVLLPGPTKEQQQQAETKQKINAMPEFDRGMIVNNPVTTPVAVGLLAGAGGYLAVKAAPIIARTTWNLAKPNLVNGAADIVGQRIQMLSDPNQKFNYFSLGASLFIPKNLGEGLANPIGSGIANGFDFNNGSISFDNRDAVIGVGGNLFGHGLGFAAGTRYLEGMAGSTAKRAQFTLEFLSGVGGSAFEMGISKKIKPTNSNP